MCGSKWEIINPAVARRFRHHDSVNRVPRTVLTGLVAQVAICGAGLSAGVWGIMRLVVRVLFASACLIGLAACDITSKNASLTPGDPASTVTSPVNPDVAETLLGGDQYDDLNLGKKHYREQNYGLAEKHFRRAVEKLPRDGEAWLGLAASYDRLRRFELADRAYKEALAILGPKPEVLNNVGYSYMLRGDLAAARAKFAEAKRRDPENPTIANNLQLVDEAARRGKGLR
jgi:tetratricopeptide (TPR) repeat protein